MWFANPASSPDQPAEADDRQSATADLLRSITERLDAIRAELDELYMLRRCLERRYGLANPAAANGHHMLSS